MNLMNTDIIHGPDGWNVEFVGDDGDAVSVHVSDDHASDADEALERAKAMMIQFTAFGTRGGGRSLNRYDTASNGNFDEEPHLFDTSH
ncbi:hypothetical protein [Rhizobium sp. BK376]|uniref:hypothetical protein n=1 Tax=Rhizobium sp. BK376 TaxID=2512149 RepID=UPI00104D8B81|nr:hypothetical protein [Rhizobium sp. BK376]TCR71044.1 hypothetical protein EV561_13510 [Rhizobium sp. BK376]